MISSVSNVNYGSARNVRFGHNEAENPQTSTSIQETPADSVETSGETEGKKSHKKAWIAAGSTLAGILVIAGLLITGARKGWSKALPEGTEAGIGKKISNFLFKAGDWLDNTILKKIPGFRPDKVASQE